MCPKFQPIAQNCLPARTRSVRDHFIAVRRKARLNWLMIILIVRRNAENRPRFEQRHARDTHGARGILIKIVQLIGQRGETVVNVVCLPAEYQPGCFKVWHWHTPSRNRRLSQTAIISGVAAAGRAIMSSGAAHWPMPCDSVATSASASTVAENG